jgi:tetratricopeptide (TPR) repeat protein
MADRALEGGTPASEALVRYLQGEIFAHPDRWQLEAAEDCYRRAQALADERGMRPLVVLCHLGLAKLYHRTGKRKDAQEHLTTATAMYREMDMKFWLEQAEAEMKELA